MISLEQNDNDLPAEKAAHITESSEAAWREYCEANDINKDRQKASDFYYPLAGKIATSFGYSDSYADASKREFVNFELHQGFGPNTALFTLMNNPAKSVLLDHLILIRAKDFSDLDVSLCEVPVSGHNFAAENDAINELYAEDSELVDRLVLTRTIGNRPGIQNALDSTRDFLQLAIDGPDDDDREFYNADDLAELKELIVPNQTRERIYAGELMMLDKLIAENVQPLAPEELATCVERYLSDLIKKDEDRLNPYSKHKPTVKLAGTIALTSWFDQYVNKEL